MLNRLQNSSFARIQRPTAVAAVLSAFRIKLEHKSGFILNSGYLCNYTEAISKLRLGQASPSIFTPVSGMEGFACQNRFMSLPYTDN
jgi:hypothetical protein